MIQSKRWPLPQFKIRITRVTTEVYVYLSTAPHLAAAQLTAETSDPDPETRKAFSEIKRVGVNEVTPKKK